MEWYHYLIIVLAAAVCLVIGCAVGFAYRKKVGAGRRQKDDIPRLRGGGGYPSD